MAVIFAVVGGGAVIGIATADPYSDYSNYSNYSNYDNYSNYSDAAERRRRRIDAKKREVEESRSEVNQYKIVHVNGYLESQSLKQESGATVNVSSVKRDADEKISRYESRQIAEETKELNREIVEIDRAIDAINKVLEEE